ncbi:AAA family ATPase [Streptomyces globisporus]|uniref:AAA family ATPase n=1 Tax=Streptomyces globisporus TaxID=1908 RepID=UPI0036C3CEDF
MIIYLRGSRGTGKTALARGLADKLGAQLLSKEELHKVLFPGEGQPLSEEKDGWLCDVLLQATAWNLEIEPTRTIVLDAQRAGHATEVPGLLRFSRALHQDLHVVECVQPGMESERGPRSRRCRPVEGHPDAVPRDRTHLVDMSAPASAALQIALSCLHASTRTEPSNGDGSRRSDRVRAAMSNAH